MMMNQKTYGVTVEVLAADDFDAVPVCITETDVVKAGTPITNKGKSAISDMSTADGVLLYDVDPTKNPNGAMVVRGIFDKKKVDAHIGSTIDVATMKTAVPGVVFREDSGINE